VRGGVVPITLSFNALSDMHLSTAAHTAAALIVGAVCLSLAAWGTFQMEESFHKDLNYIEE
jgi:hypothetical protein